MIEKSFEKPDHIAEETVIENSDDEPLPIDKPVTYSIIDGGSKRNKPKLVDNLGYSYTVKKKLAEI
jgi:hypothetical protein